MTDHQPYHDHEFPGSPYADQPAEFGHGAKRAADLKTWSLLLHLSQLLSSATAGLGIVVPLLIWQLKRDELPEIDQHGRNVMNWQISSIIYLIASALLCVILVGVPLLLLLIVVSLVFPIIGAIKANQGECWVYPMTSRFFA